MYGACVMSNLTIVPVTVDNWREAVFEEAKQKLIDTKALLKPFNQVYLSFKEALRILRKMKYDVQ